MSSLFLNRLPHHETPAIAEHTQEAWKWEIATMIDTAKGWFEKLWIVSVERLSKEQIEAIRRWLQLANDNWTPEALAA